MLLESRECFATDKLPEIVRHAVYYSHVNLYSSILLKGINRGAPPDEMAARIKAIRTDKDAERVEVWARDYRQPRGL